MTDGCSILEGEVWVKDDRIWYVGDRKTDDGAAVEELNWDEEIDCRGNVLMPGFKNAHTHSAMVAMRSFADDMPLQEWLNT